jgi:hypothetical protein
MKKNYNEPLIDITKYSMTEQVTAEVIVSGEDWGVEEW